MCRVSEELVTKAAQFKALHNQEHTFVMPCAWDAFSAMLFERSGVKCLGTTSGGVNWVKGRKDYVYTTPKAEMLQAYGEVASATRLPVSGDLENGYGGDSPEVADTIVKSIQCGMVGGSIEDQKQVPADGNFNDGVLYDLNDAVDRISAARQAADAVLPDYTLTARCEVYYTGSTDPFSEAVERLNAYRQAGADCLFIPALNKLSDLEILVKEVDGPISFGMGATETPLTTSMLEDIGIRRISTGGGLTRATFGLLQQAISEIVDDGKFGYLDGAISEADIVELLDSADR